MKNIEYYIKYLYLSVMMNLTTTKKFLNYNHFKEAMDGYFRKIYRKNF